jgi:HlyD family secretion protein
MIRSAQNRPLAVTAGLTALAAVAAAFVVGSAATIVRAQGATANQGGAAATKSVAALGRLEPAGGIVRLGLPSTPEAISGAVITRIHVERGADVKAGQILAEADTIPVLKAHLAESRADLETARRDAVASVSLAEEACVLADVAARQSRRQDELLQRRLTSDDVAEQSKGNAEAGAATCKARRAAASVAQSRIASADAAVTRHQAELDRAYVRAPFAGRILDVHAHVGELVGAHGVFELGRVDQMVAIAEVYETDIRHVRVGQKARIKSDALAADLTGTVARIRPKVQKLDEIGTDPAARKDARIIEVEIKLDDSAPAASLSLLQVEIEIRR